jgi:hypothetical protein
MVAKAIRQPANPAINVPAGTPRTVAIEMPAAMIVVARVIMGFGTKRLPSVTAMVQNPPTLTPKITRPASITAKLEASAQVILETTSSPINISTRLRRSALRAPIVISGAAKVATNPGMVTISPAVPSETCSPAEICVNKPIGRNSEVTKTNAPSETDRTANHDFKAEP